MSDLGTISILVDVQGRPVINQLATDLDKVAVAENKVSKATQDLINNLKEVSRIKNMASKSADDLSNSFRRLSGVELQRASERMANFESTLVNSRRGMGSFGVVTQQAGYQIGDFLVQVQSGTNWMVAFGQQATQLVGVLPMMTGFMGLSTGALVGLSAGLGIAIPLITAIGAAFMRTSEESDKAATAIDKQKQAYDALVESIVRLRNEREMLSSGAATTEEQNVLNEINRLELQRAGLLAESADLAARINQEGATSLGAEVERINLALQANTAEQQRLQNVLRIAEEERKRLVSAEALKQAHAQQVQYMGQTQNAQRLMTIAATEALDKYSKMRTVAAGLANELKRGADETFRMAQQQASLNYGKIMNTGDSGPDAARRGVIANMPNPFGVLTGGAGGVAAVSSDAGGGGGGAGAVTTLQNKMGEVYKYLELDQYLVEQETIAFEQRQDVLRSALENKMVTLQEYNELEKALSLQHQQDLANIEANSQQKRLSDTADVFGQLATIASVGGQKTAKAVATFQAIEGTINAYGAAIKALNTPGIGLAGRFAAYASVLAAGLKGVAAIRSAGGVGGGSGSGGSSPGSATVAQSAAPATPQTVLISGLDPNALFTGEQLSRLFENFYKENDNRGKVFVVAR